MTLPITQPFPLFADRNGSPLDQGYIYIGTAGTNPETSPIQCYWDSAMSIPAAQPLRTVNGYIARNGAPAAVYVNADSFACTVKDRGRVTVVYAASVAAASLASVNAAAAYAAAAAISESNAAASAVAAANAAANIPTSSEFEDYVAKLTAPIGSIVAFAGTVPPYGYLECNGAPINRSTYADLFTAIGIAFGAGDGSTTFNVPDLRGEFVRGWDHGRGIDSGRAFASAQSGQNLAHTHKIAITGGTGVIVDAFGTGTNVSGRAINTGTVTSAYNEVITTSDGGSETRPRSIALMYCIKAYEAALAQTPPQAVVTESTTARTLALADQSRYIRCTNAGTTTITVPTNAVVPFPLDTEITIFRANGPVAVAASGGVTINAAGTSISAQYRAATLKKVATDTWDLVGAV